MSFTDFDPPPQESRGFVSFDTPEQKPEGLLNAASRGLKESFQQLPQLGYGVGAGVAAAAETVLGEGGVATALKKSALEGYKSWEQKIAAHAQENDSIETAWGKAQDGDVGALVDWLAHGIGYVGGQGLQILASGGIGYAAGKVTAQGAAKAIAGDMIKKEVGRISASTAGKEILETAGEAAAADIIAKQATAAVAGRIGQTVALGATAVGMEGGEIFGGLVEKNADRALTGEELGRAFGATLAAGGLEFLGDKLGLDSMLGKLPTGKLLDKTPGLLGRAARGAVAGAAVAPAEAATEYGQTLLEEYGKGNEDTIDPRYVSGETQKKAIEGAAMGALGGAVMGGAGGALSAPRVKVPENILDAGSVDEAINQFRFSVEGNKTPSIDFESLAKTYKDQTPEEIAANQATFVKALENTVGYAFDDEKGHTFEGAPMVVVPAQSLPIEAPEGELTRDTYEAIAAVNQAQGMKTVVFQDDGTMDEGMVNRLSTPDTYFLSNKTKTDPVVVAAHEVQHLSETSEKFSAYAKVVDEELTEQATELAKQRHGEMTTKKLMSEIRGDLTGDAWADPTFHGRVLVKMREQLGDAKAQDTAITFMDSIRELIDRVKAVLTGTTFTTPDGQRLANQYVSNLERVHDALAAAVADQFVTKGYRPPGASTNTSQVLLQRQIAMQEAKVEAENTPWTERTLAQNKLLKADWLQPPKDASPELKSAMLAATKAPFDRSSEERLNLEAVRMGVQRAPRAPQVEEGEAAVRLTPGEQKFFSSFNEADMQDLRESVPSARLVDGHLVVAKAEASQLEDYVSESWGGAKKQYGGGGAASLPKSFANAGNEFINRVRAVTSPKISGANEDSAQDTGQNSGWRIFDGGAGGLTKEQAQKNIDFKLNGNSVVRPSETWKRYEFRVVEDSENKGSFLIEGRRNTDIQRAPKVEGIGDLSKMPEARLGAMLDQVGKSYVDGELNRDQYQERANPIIDAKTKAYLRETGAKSMGVLKDAFPGFRQVPIGTQVLATHGTAYSEPTKARVVGTRTVQLPDGLYMLPKVDFGDGRPRTITPTGIKEVYAPRGVQRAPRAPQTPEFKQWFGNSAIRDRTSSRQKFEDAPPKPMYVGRRGDFTSFQIGRETTNDGTFGPSTTTRAAVFLSESPEMASDFASGAGGNVVMAYVRAANPLDLTQGLSEADEAKLSDAGVSIRNIVNVGEKWELFDGEYGKDFVAGVKRAGFDAVWFNENRIQPGDAERGASGEETATLAVFDPNQIKSVFNDKPTESDDISRAPNVDKAKLKAEKAKIEAARATNQGTYLNVGLSTKELRGPGTFIHQSQIAPELAKFGVNIISTKTHGSRTEPTAVVRIDRPLTVAQLDALSVALFQQAIPQLHNGSGVMAGPMASAWGPFDPAQFYMQNGKTMQKNANVFPITSKKGREVPPAIDRLTGIQSAFALAGSQMFETGRDFKVALQERLLAAAKLAGVDLSADTPANRDYLRRAMLAEVLEGIRTNPNAIGWYDEKVTKALRILSKMHPEILTDEESRFAFIWALAVTSNGMKVDKNFQLAERAYVAWKKSGGAKGGAFALVGEGPTKKKINDGLEMYTEMKREHGFADLKKIMFTRSRVRDIEAQTGIKPSGEALDEILFGAAILGPKIGNGFFMNLNGEFGQLTMDRWWQRMWGRLTGTLIVTNKEAVDAAKKSFTEIIGIINSDPESKELVERNLLGRRLSLSNLAELAEDIRKATSKEHVREILALVLPADKATTARIESILGKAKKGKAYRSVGDELRKAALRYWKALDGQKEAPTPPDRRMMRSIAYQVLDQVKQTHPNITMADLQAILWYPEKRVYDAAGLDETAEEGYEDSEAPDYANAAAKLARSNGITEEQIQDAIREAERDIAARNGSGRAGRGDPGVYGESPAVEGGTAQRTPDTGGTAGAGVDGGSSSLGVERSPRQEGRLDLVGVHYSSQSRQAINGSFFGTGMKGAEAARVMASADDRIKTRVYAYVNKGPGVTPEKYVGGQAHVLQLPNLYDADADPLNIMGRNDTEFESAVLDAGFNGYLVRGPRQGVAVLLGDSARSVPAESRGTGYLGQDLPAAPEPSYTAETQLAIDVANSKELPSGQMSGADWKRVLEKMAPVLYGRLVENGAAGQIQDSETYYRDGIARLARSTASTRPDNVSEKVSEIDMAVQRAPKQMSKPAFIRAMEAIGASADQSNPETLVVDARPGYEWASTGTTALVVPFSNNGGGSWVPAAIRQAVEDATPGMRKVTDEDRIAEIEYERDEDWRAPEGAPDLIKPFEGVQRAPKAPSTPGFKKWFGDSKVVDENGDPLVVYRGEHGEADKQIHTRHGAISFGSKGTANIYALSPNDSQDRGNTLASRIIPAYLRIENPVFENREDPFIDMSQVEEKLGREEALRIARKFADNIENTDNWREIADEGFYDVDAFLTAHPDRVGDLYMDAYPLFDDKAEVEKMKARGYDGAIHVGNGDSSEDIEYKVFSENQIKSAIGNNGDFAGSNPDISRAPKIVGDSRRKYSAEQRRMFQNVGRTVQVPTIGNRLAAIRKDFGKKLAQGLVDQFAPLKDLSKQAYTMARLSKGSSGAFEAMLKHGKIQLKDGAYDADMSGGFLQKVGIPLHGELEDFLWWVAAHRADRLSKEDRENLFTRQDIAAGKSLASGTTSFDYTTRTGAKTRSRNLIYADALKNFDEFNRNALDMAEKSGLIDPAARKIWEHEFYVPFYRVSEEDGAFVGAKMANGLVRQRAFKKLKGGDQKLNSDLLANTLANWAHLLDAGAKNRAAKASLEAAVNMGVAVEADARTVKSMARSAGMKNATVWFMDQGTERHFLVDDPMVMAAITSLEYAGMKGPLMDALSTFKHVLTVGVTASPAFKVRNLIRDSMQAVATSPLGYNVLENVKAGYAASDPRTQTYVSALASGGLIRFGTMIEGRTSDRVRQLVRMGVKDSTILDSDQKLRAMYDKFIEPAVVAYNELGNRSEEINRAALFTQLKSQGVNHAEAALLARDMMDFSLQGSWTGVRFLTQVVPFMNARLQGLYKLGRGAKADPKRFAAVLGATALFSVALMAAYSDDDEWKKREDWDRDNFWWFKIGGTAFRIPKPFEIGAMGTLAERGLEYFISDEMTGKRFRKVALDLVGNNLSMNPVPQFFKPIIDVYSNKDSFSGRPIESMSMENLQPDYRFTGRTSMLARATGTAGQSVTSLVGANFASPVQIDHMLRGYFGWLGAFVVGTADMMVRPLTNEPTRPEGDIWKLATQGFVTSLPAEQSRYVSHMYEQAREVEQTYGTYRALVKTGKLEDAKEFLADNRTLIGQFRTIERVKRAESQLNERIRMIERSSKTAEEKRELITRITAQKDAVARAVR